MVREAPPVEQVGLCNTQPTDTVVRPLATPTEVGVDTWRLLRRLPDDGDLDRARLIWPDPRQSIEVAEHRVGWMPGLRTLWIEGHPTPGALASPADLTRAEEGLSSALRELGLGCIEDRGVSRLDTTVTLRFPDAQEGRAFLAACAVLDYPRAKVATWGRPLETVMIKAERSGKTLARIYDKGVESRSARPGELIRLEDQRRFGTSARFKVGHVSEMCKPIFESRFAPVAASSQGLHAATLPVVSERLRAQVREGDLDYRTAERLAGYLLLQGGEAIAPDRMSRRRRRELREHGLVVSEPMEDPIEVDVGAALDAALSAWDSDEVSS